MFKFVTLFATKRFNLVARLKHFSMKTYEMNITVVFMHAPCCKYIR